MEQICPICKREMISGISVDEHHLIPRTFKGRETITLHRVCHQKLHSVFTEREMFRYYHTIDRLIENEEIVKFIKWLKKKDPEFYNINKETKRKKSKRKK